MLPADIVVDEVAHHHQLNELHADNPQAHIRTKLKTKGDKQRHKETDTTKLREINNKQRQKETNKDKRRQTPQSEKTNKQQTETKADRHKKAQREPNNNPRV